MPSNITIRLLADIDEIEDLWPAIRPILKRATDRSNGCYHTSDVLQQALNRQVGVVVIEDPAIIAVAVVDARQFPRKRVLDIPFMAVHPDHEHRDDEWGHQFVTEMRALKVRSGGEDMTSCCARKGFARFWKDYGAEPEIIGHVIACR